MGEWKDRNLLTPKIRSSPELLTNKERKRSNIKGTMSKITDKIVSNPDYKYINPTLAPHIMNELTSSQETKKILS